MTFLYPGAEKWISSFHQSLLDQSDKNFNVIAFQDQVSLELFFHPLDLDIEFVAIQDASTPYEVRLKALEHLKKIDNDSLFIFNDIDDQLAPERIKSTKKIFQNEEVKFSFCDLSLMDKDGKIFTRNIWRERTPNTLSYHDFTDWNMIGFGNTAFRGSLIPQELISYIAKVTAGDWFFFYCLLKQSNEKIYFLNEDLVYYRQHDSNDAGLAGIREDRLLIEIKVKIQQFSAISSKYPDSEYGTKLSAYIKLEKFIQNRSNRLIYLAKIKEFVRSDQYWWEHIKTLEEVGLNDDKN